MCSIRPTLGQRRDGIPLLAPVISHFFALEWLMMHAWILVCLTTFDWSAACSARFETRQDCIDVMTTLDQRAKGQIDLRCIRQSDDCDLGWASCTPLSDTLEHPL